jgi:hypothetical protein
VGTFEEIYQKEGFYLWQIWDYKEWKQSSHSWATASPISLDIKKTLSVYVEREKKEKNLMRILQPGYL